MELLANIYDPKIPLSVLMLQLGFKRMKTPPRNAVAAGRPVCVEIAAPAHEICEEPERWDGLS